MSSQGEYKVAIYEVVHKGLIYGQVWINRYHYATPDLGVPVGFDAQDVVESFIDTVQTPLAAVMPNNADYRINDVIVRSLYDDSDFGETLAQNVAGSNGTSQPMPPFVAGVYRTPRLRTGKRRGYKRFAGCRESAVTGNVWSDPASSLGLALEAALESVLPVPLASPTALLTPVILFLEFKGLDENGRREYGYYDTEAEQVINSHSAQEWEYYRLTTQTSRQLGQGQ